MSDKGEEPAVAEGKAEMPMWLDGRQVQGMLHEMLQKMLKEVGQECSYVETSEVVQPGDNSRSALHRVIACLVDGTEHSLVVKSPPPAPRTAAAVRRAGLFTREANMLIRVVPQMEALLEAAAPGHFPPFAARCSFRSYTPVDFLVLQDLKPLGFQTAECKRGLGLRHCIIAMRRIASFHAASVALLNRDPTLEADLRSLMITEGPYSMEPIVQACLQQAADACRSWEGFEPYASDLEALKGSLVQKIAALNQPTPGEFNVIVHGGFWTNNLMFSYEDGVPVDMRMVDFQLSRVASPAVDLLHFLSTSPSVHVSECHEALLLREYHVMLCDALELLGAEAKRAPSLGELLAAVQAHGACAVLGAVSVLPLAKATREDAADETANAGRLYQESALRRWLERVLPEYKEKGWLDA